LITQHCAKSSVMRCVAKFVMKSTANALQHDEVMTKLTHTHTTDHFAGI